MAFRIHDSVVRGEIDNCVKGLVRGRIWLVGRAGPITLELRGNAHPDLAGCLLTFTNPGPCIPHPPLDSLHPVQRGVIGDLTASRKVRVFDVPADEVLAMIRRQEKPPEHLANCLYLEWFSEANGRVVIESADYQLTLSAPEWRLTPEEETQRAREAAHGMDPFLQQLDRAIEAQQRGQKDPEVEWDEHDYERFFREADARTEKYGELLDKYGHSDEALEKIAEQMGWDRDNDFSENEEMSVDELNALGEASADEPPSEPDPRREGIDWIRTGDGKIAHPLQHRCGQSALKFWRAVKALGMEPGREPDVEQFIGELEIASAKLAGALQPLAEDSCPPEPAFTVAYLKRALDHLRQAQAGLEAAARRGCLPEPLVTEARRELFAIREGILRLMNDLRGRL